MAIGAPVSEFEAPVLFISGNADPKFGEREVAKLKEYIDRGGTILAEPSDHSQEFVDSMHERKALMADLSDAFVALPGGLGTIEEFFEVLCWSQLGLHAKPCGLLNVDGYYDQLSAFLDHTVEQQFVRASHRELVVIEQDAENLLQAFGQYRAPHADKAAWILKMNERR